MINRLLKSPILFYLIIPIIMIILSFAVSFAEADKTLKETEKTQEGTSRTAKDWFNIGVGYSEMGMHKEAAENFRQAVKIKPDFAEAHLALGISYFYLHNQEAASEEYKILQNLNPQMAEELFKLLHH